jgi:anti-sigma regulatory factor (Ser/Thr protein kinase)
MEQPREGGRPGSGRERLPPGLLEIRDQAMGADVRPPADREHGDPSYGLGRAISESFARALPSVAGVDLASTSIPDPSGAGAGLHDVFELPDGRLLLLAGAVHAGGAAGVALGESVRTAVRAVAMVAPSPRYILGAVNQLLLQERRGTTVTAALLLLDPRSGEVLVSSAGHPAPIRIGAGAPRVLDAPSGPALGEAPAPYFMRRFDLAAGDTVVLYTNGRRPDGAVAPSSDDRRLMERLSRLGPVTAGDLAGEMLRLLPSLADRFTGEVGLVVVRLTSVERVSERELALDAPLASWRLAEIRQSVREFLAGHQLSTALIDDIVLCVEEACTNVIRHSGSATPGRLTVAVDEQVVEVVLKDEGRGFGMVLPDPGQPPDPLAGGGRGVYLMARLSDEIEFWNEGGACLRLRRSVLEPGRLHGLSRLASSDR